MRFPVDLELFRDTKHSPTIPMLERSMQRPELKLRDYCIPVNPYFPTDEMLAHFRERLAYVLKFYPEANEGVESELAEALGLPADGVVLANGSTELITWIDHLLIRDSIATPVPTFGRWTDQPEETGKRVHPFFLEAKRGFETDVDEFIGFVRSTGARAAAICNPNNPTGSLLGRADVARLLDGLADLDVVVIDESFLDFALEPFVPTASHIVYARENAIVLKSLGKNFGLHGARAGYAVANPKLAARIRKALPRWNVNALAIELVRAFRANAAAYEASRRRVVRDRMEFEWKLGRVPGLEVVPSFANYNYVRLPDEVAGGELRDRLLTEHGIVLRECGNKIGSSSQYFRIATRPPEEQDILVRALREAIPALGAEKGRRSA